MILFKHPEKQREYAELRPELRKVVREIERVAWEKFGDEIVVTSMYRGDSSKSVHAWYRGIDIAILEHGGLEGSEWVRSYINQKYPYGKLGCETVPPLDHGTAAHLHVQII